MQWSSWAFVLLVGSLGCTPNTAGMGSGGDGAPVGTGGGSTGSGSTGPEATTAVTTTAGSTSSSDGTTDAVDASSGTTSPLDESTTASGDESSTGSLPPQSLPEVDCAAEGTITSTEASTPASVTFHNESGQPRQLEWLDYAGTRQPFGTIPPGDAWGFATYVTHPWLIADERGQCLTIFVTVAGMHDIILY